MILFSAIVHLIQLFPFKCVHEMNTICVPYLSEMEAYQRLAWL